MMESSLGPEVTKIQLLGRTISISRCRAARFASVWKVSLGLSSLAVVNIALCRDCERCAGLLVLKLSWRVSSQTPAGAIYEAGIQVLFRRGKTMSAQGRWLSLTV